MNPDMTGYWSERK